MVKDAYPASWQSALNLMAGTFLVVIVLTALSWGRALFIPLALAIFLTFILSPLANWLGRWVKHGPAVAIVVALTIFLLASVSWIVVQQGMSLLDELPRHTEEIKAKIQSIREMMNRSGGGRVAEMVEELSSHFKLQPPPGPANPDLPGGPEGEKIRAVIVQSDHAPWLTWLASVMGQVMEFFTLFALAVVLFVFMLAKRADLRNRFLRLAGLDRLTVTTRAVDDAAHRISRFLVMQAVINISFGLVMTIGLFVLGVPHATLWGFLFVVLRYVPYLGAPLAALFPLTASLAFSPGWLQPILVVVLYLVLELIYANFLEPLLFGHSMGVSVVALLFSAAFWGFLWGPIGLVLSGPLTVCLLVLGKYVPELQLLEVLLGEEPPLEPPVSYYQRLMARDQDEAAQIVQKELAEKPAESVLDDLLVPALAQARQDRQRDELSEEDERFILEATREITEEVSEYLKPDPPETAAPAEPAKRLRLLACPARDACDQVALEMFRPLLNPGKWEVQVADATLLATELLALVERWQPAVVLIGSLPPGNLAHTRYLCKRLRTQFPNLHILVGRWAQGDGLDAARTALKAAGADHVEGDLRGCRDLLQTWFSVLVQDQEAAPARREGLKPAFA